MDDFDWATVLVSLGLSAVVSAVVGAVVGLATAGWVVQRQERSRARWEAKRRVAAVVSPLLQEVRKYRTGLSNQIKREADRPNHAGDYEFASAVIAASADLTRLRRRLVLIRLGRLVGDQLELAVLQPADMSSPGSIFTPLLIGATRGRSEAWLRGPGCFTTPSFASPLIRRCADWKGN